MQILSTLIGLVGLYCFIKVMIALYKAKGALHVVLGIVSCGIYPYIWGWIESGRLGLKNIMLLWTAVIVVNIGLTLVAIMAGAAAASHQ